MSHPQSHTSGSVPLATVWVLGAAIFWASMPVTVRFLEGRVPSWDISFYRALVAMMIGGVPMYFSRGRTLRALVPQRKFFGGYVLRGMIIFVSQAIYYYALIHMSLADATVLNATTPIFSAVMAIFMLNERVGADRWLLILLGFAGVVVIIRPGYQEVPIEALLALGSAVLFAFAAILNKRLVAIESGMSIVYGTNFFVAVCGLPVVLGWGVRPNLADLAIVALIGAFGVGAQYCLSRALVHGEISYLSPFEFLRVPLVAFGAWLLFDQVPAPIFVVGALMIFASVYMLARRAVRLRPVPRPAG